MMHMAIKETIRGKVRGPKEVELEEALGLPVGSEVSITISSPDFLKTSLTKASGVGIAERFKGSAGSWKDIPEEFIKNVYADRLHSARGDVVL